MKKVYGFCLCILVLSLCGVCKAAEPLPVRMPLQLGPPGAMPATTFGASVAIGWTDFDWEVGEIDGSDTVWVPELALFYVIQDGLDVRLSAKFASGDDRDDGTDVDGDFTRFTIGSRYWINLDAFVTPYVGASVGYYGLDMASSGRNISVDDGIGYNLEAGCALGLSDGFVLTLGLSYDDLITDADATVNGADADASIRALGANVGVVVLF